MKSRNVPELDELVMGTAGKKVFVPRASYILYWFTNVLPYTANDPIRQDVDSPAGKVKNNNPYSKSRNKKQNSMNKCVDKYIGATHKLLTL